jgi:NADPH:quinone reductase-like Zn-dependent oxidoreductase
MPFPFTMGYEFAGTIEDLDEADRKDFKVGQRRNRSVVIYFFSLLFFSLFLVSFFLFGFKCFSCSSVSHCEIGDRVFGVNWGEHRHDTDNCTPGGAFAEYIALPLNKLSKIQKGMSDRWWMGGVSLFFG